MFHKRIARDTTLLNAMTHAPEPHAVVGTTWVLFATAITVGLALSGANAASANDEPPGICADIQIQVDHDAARVALSWPPIDGASVYVVHRQLEGGGFETIATLPADETAFVDDPAPEGVLDYRVAANGPPDDTCPTANAHIGGEPPVDPEPTCIGGLTATARAGGSIRIEWPALPGAAGYDILRAENDGPLTPYAVVGGDRTSFDDTSTVPGQTYRYTVVANGLPPQGVVCESVEATAVPFLGTIMLAGVALGGTLLAFGLARRKR